MIFTRFLDRQSHKPAAVRYATTEKKNSLFPAQNSSSQGQKSTRQHGRVGEGGTEDSSEKETDFFYFLREAWFTKNFTLKVGKAITTTENHLQPDKTTMCPHNESPLGSTGTA